MTEAILFDMDGVVLVGSGTHPGVYRMAAHDALREVGVRNSECTHAAILEETHYSEAMDDACAALGVDLDAWWAARERHASRRTNARVRSGARPVYEDVAAIVDLAADRRLGLVSNNRQATASFVADYCLPNTFEVAIGRTPTIEDYGNRKPESTLIERGMDRMNVESGLYVGDRETDMIAAERAGLDGVFLERPHNDAATLGVEPAHVVASLTELRDLVATLSG